MGDAVQGEAAALVEGVEPARGRQVAEQLLAAAAAEAMDSRVALAEIDADNASAWDVQEHQLAQVEAFAAAEVAASQEVDALVEEVGLLQPEEQRAMDLALRLDLLDL